MLWKLHIAMALPLLYTAKRPVRGRTSLRDKPDKTYRFKKENTIHMVMHVKFDSLADLEALQKLANAADAPVYLSSEDESLQVDARTFLGLFSVDFSKPVKVVTDSLYVIRRLEQAARRHDAQAM